MVIVIFKILLDSIKGNCRMCIIDMNIVINGWFIDIYFYDFGGDRFKWFFLMC